jgi:hypothetical protein
VGVVRPPRLMGTDHPLDTREHGVEPRSPGRQRLFFGSFFTAPALRFRADLVCVGGVAIVFLGRPLAFVRAMLGSPRARLSPCGELRDAQQANVVRR